MDPTDGWISAEQKADKALLELLDKLKPAGKRYPAHIHAAREADEDGMCSLICLQAVDYSRGTGEKSVSVYANISPEEAQFIYSRVFSCEETFVFSRIRSLVKRTKTDMPG